MDNKCRIIVALSVNAYEFLERERHYGTVADSLECLLVERSALLQELLHLNETANQIGVAQRPLHVEMPHIPDHLLETHQFKSNKDQAYRIKQHLRGYDNPGKGIDHLVVHLQHLRHSVQDLKFDCARALLNQRLQNTYAVAS